MKLYIVLAKHQRLRKSWLVVFAGATAIKKGSTRHDTKNRRTFSPRPQLTQQQTRGLGTGGTLTQTWQVMCAIQVSRKKKNTEAEMVALELKSREKIKVLTGLACWRRLCMNLWSCLVSWGIKEWKYCEIVNSTE